MAEDEGGEPTKNLLKMKVRTDEESMAGVEDGTDERISYGRSWRWNRREDHLWKELRWVEAKNRREDHLKELR